jgi:cell division inhibitor SepF
MQNTPRLDWSVQEFSQAEVVVKTVKSVEETGQALQLLQQRKTVILVLDRLSVDQAQRVVDWMAGGTCAIDGQTFWIGEKTFLFVPNQVEIISNRSTASPVSPYLKQAEGVRRKA